MIRRFVVSLSLLLFSLPGCSLLRPSLPYSSRYPGPQPLEVIEKPVQLRQRLTVEVGSRSFSFRTVMEINSDQSTFVLLSPVGSQLFTVVQRGHSLSVDKRSDVNFPIDPRRLYVDLQLMLWPRVQVEDPYVVKHELEADKDSTSRHVRWLVRSNKKFSKITATTFSGLKGKRVLKHYDGSYTLRLETFQVDYLEPGSTR